MVAVLVVLGSVALGLGAALVVMRVVPSTLRIVCFLSGMVAATVFLLAHPVAGSWARAGEDVFVVLLMSGWIAGFGVIALARIRNPDR